MLLFTSAEKQQRTLLIMEATQHAIMRQPDSKRCQTMKSLSVVLYKMKEGQMPALSTPDGKITFNFKRKIIYEKNIYCSSGIGNAIYCLRPYDRRLWQCRT